ncbi:MAG: hypothetical protein JWQ36_2222 [Enterovirga sp.]|nr:hypothetical protein [Enterovirga sp.]
MRRLGWAALTFAVVLTGMLLAAAYAARALPTLVAERLERETGLAWRVGASVGISLVPDVAITLGDARAEVQLAAGTAAQFEARQVRLLASPLEILRAAMPRRVEIDGLTVMLPPEWWRFVDVAGAIEARPRSDSPLPGRIVLANSAVVFKAGPGRSPRTLAGIAGDLAVEENAGARSLKVDLQAPAGSLNARLGLTQRGAPAEDGAPLEFRIEAAGLRSKPLVGRTVLGTDGPRVILSQLTGTLGDSTWAGAALLDLTAKPLVRIDVSIPTLRLDGGPDAGPALSPGDLDVLQDFDGRLGLRAKSVAIGSVTASDVAADIQLADGVVTARLAEAGFHGGTIAGTLSLVSAGAEPRYALSAELRNVSSLPLFSRGFGLVDGTLTASFDVAGSGWRGDEIGRSLAGTARIEARNGRLNMVDLPALAQLAAAHLPSVTQRADAGRTAFDQLTASFTIEGGRAETRDLAILGPVITAKGAGSIDLTAKSVAFSILTQLVGFKGMAQALNDLQIPVVIEGPWDGPRSRIGGAGAGGAPSPVDSFMRGPLGGLLDRLLSPPPRDNGSAGAAGPPRSGR